MAALLEQWQTLSQRYGWKARVSSLQDVSPAAIATIIAGMFQESLSQPFLNETQACQAALDFLAQDVLEMNMAHITASGLQDRDHLQQANLAEILTALEPLVAARSSQQKQPTLAQPSSPARATLVRSTVKQGQNDHQSNKHLPTMQEMHRYTTTAASPSQERHAHFNPGQPSSLAMARSNTKDTCDWDTRMTALRQERDALEVSARALLGQARSQLAASYHSDVSSPRKEASQPWHSREGQLDEFEHQTNQSLLLQAGLTTYSGDNRQDERAARTPSPQLETSFNARMDQPRPSSSSNPQSATPYQSPARTRPVQQLSEVDLDIHEPSPSLTMSQLHHAEVDSLDSDPRAVHHAAHPQSETHSQPDRQGESPWIKLPDPASLPRPAPSVRHTQGRQSTATQPLQSEPQPPPSGLPLPARTRLLPTHTPQASGLVYQDERSLTSTAAAFSSTRPLHNHNIQDLEPASSGLNHRREQLLHQVLHNATAEASSPKRRTSASAVTYATSPTPTRTRASRSQRNTSASAPPNRRRAGRKKPSTKARGRAAARELSRPPGRDTKLRKKRSTNRRAEAVQDLNPLDISRVHPELSLSPHQQRHIEERERRRMATQIRNLIEEHRHRGGPMLSSHELKSIEDEYVQRVAMATRQAEAEQRREAFLKERQQAMRVKSEVDRRRHDQAQAKALHSEFHRAQARRGHHAADAEQQELLGYVETRLRDHQANLRAAKQQAKAEVKAAEQEQRAELLELREFYLDQLAQLEDALDDDDNRLMGPDIIARTNGLVASIRQDLDDVYRREDALHHRQLASELDLLRV
eukprot:m.134076 g.134076  ORF g.134076 m.134076 type:complete len:813 (-) comp15968_c0_seq7:20-2458(-)